MRRKIISIVSLCLLIFVLGGCTSNGKAEIKSIYGSVINSAFEEKDKYYSFKVSISDDFFVKAESIVQVFSDKYTFDIGSQIFTDVKGKDMFSYGAVPYGLVEEDGISFISGSICFKNEEESYYEDYMLTIDDSDKQFVVNDKIKEFINIIYPNADISKFSDSINKVLTQKGNEQYIEDGIKIVIVSKSEGSKNKITVLFDKQDRLKK